MKRLLILLSGLLLSNLSYGSLVAKDWLTVGDSLITLDTESGLEWLDLTETSDMTYEEVMTLLQPDNQLQSWQFAALDQIALFFDHAGGSSLYTGYQEQGDTTASFLLSLWGANRTNSEDSRSTFITGEIIDTGNNQFGAVVDYLNPSESDYIVLDSGPASHTWGHPHMGSALIRVSSPVPIPTAVWLFGSGLIGLLGIRRIR